MDPLWREHFEALARFNAWEAAQRRTEQRSYSDSLRWLSEAWELAARYGAPPEHERHAQERLERTLHLRDALRRARLPG